MCIKRTRAVCGTPAARARCRQSAQLHGAYTMNPHTWRSSNSPHTDGMCVQHSASVVGIDGRRMWDGRASCLRPICQPSLLHARAQVMCGGRRAGLHKVRAGKYGRCRGTHTRVANAAHTPHGGPGTCGMKGAPTSRAVHASSASPRPHAYACTGALAHTAAIGCAGTVASRRCGMQLMCVGRAPLTHTCLPALWPPP